MNDYLATYLGDGLYAVFDGYQITLRANDLQHPTNTVYLNQYVWETLYEWVKKFWEPDDD